MEGRLATLLGAEVQPVDLAKRLAEHMEDRRTIGAGRVYVPNAYRVYLAPRTLAGFASFQGALEEELAGFLSARAAERGYHFVGRVVVRTLADPELPRERVRLESDVVDPRGLDTDHGLQRTRAIAVPEADAPQPAAPIAMVVGTRRIVISGTSPLSVGRSLDNDVIVDGPSVSRRHARLVPRGTHWLLEDLNSTHGTFVNGHRVSASLLRPGDQIRLGSQVAHLRSLDASGHEGDPAAGADRDPDRDPDRGSGAQPIGPDTGTGT